MTHDELIAEARKHLERFERLDKCHIRTAGFPNVRVREAVVVYFTCGDRDDKIDVWLDRETGEFLGSIYTPPKSEL